MLLNNVKNSRRSVMDPEQKYVGRDENSSFMPTEKGYVLSLKVTHYCVEVGQSRDDIAGSPKHYADAVVASIKGD